ncbi:hypothetical protein G6F40_013506 [Rhizopus arrhizus]|nr:hypothetical protein G6F40_013506 [Rhizopus arrhizus]
MRGLHQRQLRVTQEPATGDLQERAHRQMVAVEDRHQLAIDQGERMVEIAGLGMAVVGAGDVVHPGALGEGTELLALAVIEDVDAQFVRRPVQAHRGVHGMPYQRQIFVVGGNQHVHRRPLPHVGRQRRRSPAQRPGDLHVAQHQHQPGVGFRSQQDPAADQVEGAVPVQRGGVAPPQVAAGDGDRQHHQHQRGVAALHAPNQQGDDPQQQHEHELREVGERLGDAQRRQPERDQADQQRQQMPRARRQGADALPEPACETAVPELAGRIAQRPQIAQAAAACGAAKLGNPLAVGFGQALPPLRRLRHQPHQ